MDADTEILSINKLYAKTQKPPGKEPPATAENMNTRKDKLGNKPRFK